MMSVSSKIKAIGAIYNLSRSELAGRMQLTNTALGSKYTRDSFTAGDLIRVADALGVRLAFIDDKGQPIITFDSDDAAPPRRSGQKATSVDTKNSDTKN